MAEENQAYLASSPGQFAQKLRRIGPFRYFKIHLKTIVINTRLRGINPANSIVYSPEPRAAVYWLKLNINIWKLGYSVTSFTGEVTTKLAKDDQK